LQLKHTPLVENASGGGDWSGEGSDATHGGEGEKAILPTPAKWASYNFRDFAL
jgi:hypothetical protein